MTRARPRPRDRKRGSIDTLRSGALRVRVYAGVDPISKRRHDLIEIVPADTPNAAEVAEKIRTRFLNQLDERRHPRTKATVGKLLERHLKEFDGAAGTVEEYRGLINNHINKCELNRLKVGELDADILDSFYADCRRCRDHCDGRPYLQHRTNGTHTCDNRCRPHECTSLAAGTIRHIHFLLSGAYKRALRWNWVSINPTQQTEPPAAPPPNPRPPTAPQAARIINEAWTEADWGTFIWVAMTTGARRGEMCALRWSDLNLDPDVATAWIRRAISKDKNKRWVEGPTKTHQQRSIVLDSDTVVILTEHRGRCQERAAALDIELPDDAFVFSGAPDGMQIMLPGSVTQRYNRLAERLNIDTTLHKLRHYSATELILAGVDVRTVGGRLGHSGGGATTLRVYTAFVSEADQRASRSLSARMPERPAPIDPEERPKTDPRAPYEHIAASVRRAILGGDLAPGDGAPSMKELAAEHGVSTGTAHRALSLLTKWGLIQIRPGQRAVVLEPPPDVLAELGAAGDVVEAGEQRELLDLEVLHLGKVIRKVRAEADPNSARELRQLLVDALRRHGGDEAQIGEYEVNVRYAGERGLITTFVAAD